MSHAPPLVRAGITFHHPVAFWVGAVAIVAGVLLHLPDFFQAGDMGYRMAGMPMSWIMGLGMVLIVGGMPLAAYGLLPRGQHRPSGARPLTGMQLHAMDRARLSPAHWGLVVVLGVALVVDVMKPATLGFVVPGTMTEYGLTTRTVALLPMAALTGTTVGSILWGMLADRVGRRAAILLASLMFIGTAICGFMPSFGWNLFMCFIMGMSAGGMLPIVYALMAESIPARQRGWLIVLHAGLGAAGGYLLASGQAALLEPIFTWRILWFAGLPTGLLVLLLNRWIPESPRFLLEHGRVEEAQAIMARYGVVMEPAPAPETVPAATPAMGKARVGVWHLFRPPYMAHTATVLSYGLGWGLVNWGFVTFIPTILQDRGASVGYASKVLFESALIAIPGTVVAALLYGYWSSKKSMILFALLTVAALIGFAVVDPEVGPNASRVLMPLTVALFVGAGGVIAMLSPYTAEVYPTGVRATASGLAAGSSKVGGIIGPPLVAGIVAILPGFGGIGVAVALPVLASAVILAVTGIETRNRSLQELDAEPTTSALSTL